MASPKFNRILMAMLGAGSASAFPAADQFSFADAFNTGNTALRDRTGWEQSTSDARLQNTELVNTATPALTILDGFGANGLSYQETGRIDGGSASVTLATSASDWFVVLNGVDEQNMVRADFASTLNRVRISKIVGGVTTSLFDSGIIASLFEVGQVVSVSYSWSGTTCTVTLSLNGARYPNGTTSWTFAASGLLQPCGRIGLMTTGVYSAYASTALATAPRVSMRKVHRIYQRNKTTSQGTVPIYGIAKGCTSLQFRLLQNDTVVSGWDWGQQTLNAVTVNPTTGVFSANVSGIPQGNNYQIDVRDTVDNNARSTSRKFDIGAIWILFGQSLAIQSPYATGRTTAAVANAWLPRSTTPVGDQRSDPLNFETEWEWEGSVLGGNSWTANLSQTAMLAAVRAAAPGLATSIICAGYGSQVLTAFLSSSANVPYTVAPTGAGRTLWQNLLATIDYYGGFYDPNVGPSVPTAPGDFEGFIWDQGQEDAGRVAATLGFTPTLRTAYMANFQSYIGAIRSHVGRTAAQLPVLIVGLGRLNPAAGGTTFGNFACDPSWDLFRQTQYDLTQIAGFNCALSHTQMDLVLTDTALNEVHLTGLADYGYTEDLCRAGYAMAKAMGYATTDRRGAIPLSIARTSTTLAITFDANTASALTIPSGTGFGSNFVFWTDNTYTTQLTPTAVNIGALSGGQFVVTWTFAATASGNVATSGKGGAGSQGGVYPDITGNATSSKALMATQPDGRSVITWPIFSPLVAA